MYLLITLVLVIFTASHREKRPVEKPVKKENMLIWHILTAIELFMFGIIFFSSHTLYEPEKPPEVKLKPIPELLDASDYINEQMLLNVEQVGIVVFFLTEEEKNIGTRKPLDCPSDGERVRLNDLNFLATTLFECGEQVDLCSLKHCLTFKKSDSCAQCVDGIIRISEEAVNILCEGKPNCKVYSP